MRVLVIGSGGREHALTWKLAQSPRVSALYVAPGNGGTAKLAENVSMAATDVEGLVAFAREQEIDLTVVGPEAPLVAGLVDAFEAEGLRAFGPRAAAARLEGSKAFAKEFMFAEGIPTGVAAIFDDYEATRAYLRRQELPVVVKASGLAAGKGVFVCATLEEAETALQEIMVERRFGDAGEHVLIEECLVGEETSILAFTDGTTVVPLLPARDYKPLEDGDAGPNTGGMGGYAPAPLPSGTVAAVVNRVLQPAVDGMRRRGTPYVGVLYAGLMLTAQGPRVLEFNCRFGDPETQVLLPLLETDLVEIALASIEGRLHELAIRWSAEVTATVVMASGGYPVAYEKGKPITGVAETATLPHVAVFQAGTRCEGDALLTDGGRVLAATAWAENLAAARARAYAAVNKIDFEGAYYRTDIAAGVVGADEETATPPESAYAAAGVDIEAKMGAFEKMRAAVESTYTPAVLAGLGSFGGLFSLEELLEVKAPVLVSSTDGVGTKTMIAEQMGRYDTIGHDIVNHCINDVLVQGARPLFFLDYVASSRLDPDVIVALVGSCAEACRAAGCVLIGGETAEMPGVYRAGTFDLVGTLVGWVARDAIIDGRDVRPGDVCVGLPSTGLHTNGYSLARYVFADVGWDAELPELDRPLGEALLTPHKSYLPEFEALTGAGVTLKAMSHITGGSFPDNLPRVLPEDVGAVLDRSAWEVPSIFHLIRERGQVDLDEMYHVFNMGVGMVLVLDADDVATALAAVPDAVVIGETVVWDGDGAQIRFEEGV